MSIQVHKIHFIEINDLCAQNNSQPLILFHLLLDLNTKIKYFKPNFFSLTNTKKTILLQIFIYNYLIIEIFFKCISFGQNPFFFTTESTFFRFFI